MGKMGFDIMNALWKRTGSAKETLRSCPFLFEETFDAFLRTSNRLHPRLRGTVLDDIVSCGYMAWYQFFSIQTRVYSFI